MIGPRRIGTEIELGPEGLSTFFTLERIYLTYVAEAA